MRGKAVEERPSVGAGAGAGGAGGHEKQVALKEIDYSKRQKEVTRAEGESDESVAKKEKAAFQEMVDNFLQEAVVAQYFLDPKHGHAPHNHVVQMLETKKCVRSLWPHETKQNRTFNRV
jgi:hypothetical protein